MALTKSFRKNCKQCNIEIICFHDKKELCDKCWNKEYRINKRNERREYNKQYKLDHPEWNKEQQRKQSLKSKFGLTIKEWNKTFQLQNGCCAICGKHQSEFTKRFAVDHNHFTDGIRGLLCDKCNRGLGYFNDQLDILENAVNYLKKWSK